MVVPKSTTAVTVSTTSKKNNKEPAVVTAPVETNKQTTKSTTTTTKSTTTKKAAATTVVVEQPKVVEPVVVATEQQIVKPIYTRPTSTDSNLTTTPVVDTEWYNMDIKSGGSFIKIPPILIDSENLLLSNNNTIKIYNPNTGLIKSETSLESTNETITYITSTQTQQQQTLIYLSSSLGKFYQFNTKQKTIDLIYRSHAAATTTEQNVEDSKYKKGIVKFVICPSNSNIIYFLNQDGELCTFNGKTGTYKSVTTNGNGSILKNLQYISISQNGQLLVIASKSLIQVLNLSTTNIVLSKYYKSEYQITSVSIIPKLIIGSAASGIENLQISFGTTLGRLNFINFNSTTNTITFSSYNHWHSTPLISTHFNIDGTLLFTGGYENSLAIWTVSNMRRKVLPRLGGAIIFINVDPQSKLCAITLSNNKVQVVKISDLKACSIITGLQSPTTSTTTTNNKITSFIDPNSNNLIFSGQKNGIVQFYNIKKDRVENEIIVSPIRNTDISTKKSKGHNLESSFNSDSLSLEQSNVEPLAFHPKKPLFVSFESFSNSSPDKLESKVALKDQILKFWETSTRQGKQECDCVFSISTPHTSNILSMSFHPTKDMLLTTSETDFKVWKKQSMETIDNTTKTIKTYWTCVHEGSYRGLKCTASAFSRDGSVFAIASGHLVVLYSSESMLQLSDNSVLTFSTSHHVSELSFLSKKGVSQILVSYKENGAIVWDVESKLPIKVYNFPIKPISVTSKYYALCPTSSRNRIMIFDIKSHNLLFTTLVEIPKNQVVDQVLFSKDQQNYDCLLAITNENLIYGYSTYKHTNNISNPTTLIGFGSVNQAGPGIIKQSISNSEHYNSKRQRLNNIINAISKDQQDDESTTTNNITAAATTTKTTTTTTTDKDQVFIGKEIFTKLPSTQEIFGAASHIMPSVQNIYQKYMDSILVNSNNLTENSNNNNNNNNSNNINNNIIENIENSNSNNKSDENNNVKKQQQQSQQLNNNKFSSMKNFFENLEEPMDISTPNPSPVATSVNGSSSASTKEIKTKSTSSSSSSSKKRKGTEN